MSVLEFGTEPRTRSAGGILEYISRHTSAGSTSCQLGCLLPLCGVELFTLNARPLDSPIVFVNNAVCAHAGRGEGGVDIVTSTGHSVYLCMRVCLCRKSGWGRPLLFAVFVVNGMSFSVQRGVSRSDGKSLQLPLVYNTRYSNYNG